MKTDNHLIIGLGGTGGRIIAAYRKIMFEKFNGNLNPENVNVEFVYVDSSEVELNATGGIWNTLGTSIALDKGSKVNIKASNLRQYVDNINNYPYLAPWVGRKEEWQHIIDDPKLQDGAAGQKRRLGRFLFANNVNRVLEVIDSKVKLLQTNTDSQRLTFHVCTGLAGGTGSGSFIDTIAQIRKTYRDYSIYKIILYLLLPEEIPNRSWATTSNYQPNGYAALMELNALDFGIFKPWDLSGRNNVRQLELSNPFYSAYLITEQNKENVRFDVEKILPATIAEFLFQKTVFISEKEKRISDAEAAEVTLLARVESGENPETSQYGFKHSFKFITFGIKRLAIPEQEIKEYFVDTLARQFILQAIYNNPSSDIGYQEEPVPNDDYSDVSRIENLEKWNLTTPKLTLSSAILDNHKKEQWKSIHDEFDVIDGYAEDMLGNKTIQHRDKLTAISNRTKKFYDREFRTTGENGGVIYFYETKNKAIKEIVKKIVQSIEDDFYHDWESGRLSFHQLTSRLTALNKYLEHKIDELKTLAAGAQNAIARSNAVMSEENTNWNNLGLIKGGWNKNPIANAYLEALKEKYRMMTFLQGYDFAQNVLRDVTGSLTALKNTVAEINATFAVAAKKLAEEIDSRCNDDRTTDTNRQSIIIKYYDPQKVRRVATGVIKDRTYREDSVKFIRDRIVKIMGENRNFEKLKDINVGRLTDEVQTSSIKIVETLFHGTEGKDNILEFEKLIGENIVKKLNQEYNGNKPGLKRKVEELIKHAAVLARHNEIQVNDAPVNIRPMLLVILPEYKEDEAFLGELKNMFRNVYGSANIQIETGGSSNEIVIINLESILTPRYLQTVETLQNAYKELVNSERGDIARFEIHLETFGKNGLPSLYKPSGVDIRFERTKLPVLLIAKNIGLVEEYEDPDTGKTKLAILRKNEWGMDLEPVFLGKDLEDSIDYLTVEIVNSLEIECSKILKEKYRHLEKQKELITQINNNDLTAIKAKYNNNLTHPVVKQFNEAGLEAVKIIQN
jgi:hypothetical protein